MASNESLVARRQAAVARGVSMVHPVFIERAENALLWDSEGRRYVDFAGGIAVLNTGHRHPAVVAAIEAQLQRFTHTCWQVVPYEGYVALAEKLNALTPGTYAKKTALFSTGAEAVENAVKIARAATRRLRAASATSCRSTWSGRATRSSGMSRGDATSISAAASPCSTPATGTIA